MMDIQTSDKMEKKILVWEPWFFMAFGLFHLHRIWGLIDRNSYAGFWLSILKNKGLFYFVLMGILAMLCILGVLTFIQNRHSNYWWRWIYLFGGVYVLFDLFAIAVGLEFWNRLLLWMFDVNSIYWNVVWSFFVLLGGLVFVLGIKLLIQETKNNGCHAPRDILMSNKSGWSLIEYLNISENDIGKYHDVTGAYAILRVADKYVIGYNTWRKQWEFPAGGIEDGETAREAASRELYEETHQRNYDLEFKGLFKVKDPKGKIKYQAVFVGWQNEIVPFELGENDEMEKIMLWDMKEDIGYVDECDVKIVQIVSVV